MITFLKVTRQLLGDIKGGVLGYRGAACIPCASTLLCLTCPYIAAVLDGCVYPSIDHSPIGSSCHTGWLRLRLRPNLGPCRLAARHANVAGAKQATCAHEGTHPIERTHEEARNDHSRRHWVNTQKGTGWKHERALCEHTKGTGEHTMRI
eukprot:1160653-Pelagomonas_calceolata.AAC.11